MNRVIIENISQAPVIIDKDQLDLMLRKDHDKLRKDRDKRMMIKVPDSKFLEDGENFGAPLKQPPSSRAWSKRSSGQLGRPEAA